MSWGRESGGEWGNGDGRFFYTPVDWNKNYNEYLLDNPVETIRLEILCDGTEDWEYLCLLKKISVAKEATSEQKAIAKKLLEIPDHIVNAMDTDYALTPENMLVRRDGVGKFIKACFCAQFLLR